MKDAQSILKRARRCDKQAGSLVELETRINGDSNEEEDGHVANDIGVGCALVASSKSAYGHPGFSRLGSSTDAVDSAAGRSPSVVGERDPLRLSGRKSFFGAAWHADRVCDAERSAKKARSHPVQQSEFATQPLIHDNMS